jgi:hypothetical protein
MGMKDEFDAFMQLNEFRFKRWENRRMYEWRVSLALWAWMALATYYLEIAKPSHHIPFGISLCAAIGVVALHLFWVRTNWIRNMKDINHAFYFADRARRLLPNESKPEPSEDQGPRSIHRGLTEKQNRWYSFLCDLVPVLELSITVALSATYLVLVK